jgi:hypothetical protein
VPTNIILISDDRLIDMFNVNNITRIAFFIIVISAPIQWITLIDAFGLSIKYVHLSIIPISLCLLFSAFRRTVIKFIQFNKVLIFSFFLLMLVNFIFTCINGTGQSIGFSYISKNLSYLFYYIAFGAVLFYRYKTKDFYKELAISNTLCTIVFLCVVEVTFLSLGRNFIGELISNFLKGDSVAIRYDLFYKLFNSHGISGDADYQTNLRNTLLGAFIYIHFTSMYSLRISKRKFINILNWSNIGFGAFLVIASTSRSNMLVLVLGYLIFFCLASYSRQLKIRPSYIFFALLGAFLFIALFSKLESVFENSTSMISDRLSQLDEDARWNLDGEALVYFGSNPLAGKGAGAVLSDGHRVHNFILGAAYQTGIVGFILSLIFYFGILYKVFQSGKILYGQKNIFWLVSLASLPLLRSMTSGNSGTMSIIEWFCLAFFLSVLMVESENNSESRILNFSHLNYSGPQNNGSNI